MLECLVIMSMLECVRVCRHTACARLYLLLSAIGVSVKYSRIKRGNDRHTSYDL